MNLDNHSQPEVKRLIDLIATTAAISVAQATAVIVAMHRAGFGAIEAPCEACRQIHPSYPSVRAFHHPLCPDTGKCRMCGAKTGSGEVGSICLTCYYGDTALD